MNRPQGEWPPSGDASAEEFRVTDRTKVFVRAALGHLPLTVLWFLCMLFLGTIVTGGNGWGGLVIAIVATGLIVGILYRKAQQGILSTVIRMSPTGVEMRDDLGFDVKLRWPDITRVGEIVTYTAKPGTSVDIAFGSVPVLDWRNTGLIGWGQRRVPNRLPRWVEEQLAQARRHPETGALEIGVPLGAIDPRWPEGGMARWVEQYRPDLLSSRR
jgi:hypothetical protein